MQACRQANKQAKQANNAGMPRTPAHAARCPQASAAGSCPQAAQSTSVCLRLMARVPAWEPTSLPLLQLLLSLLLPKTTRLASGGSQLSCKVHSSPDLFKSSTWTALDHSSGEPGCPKRNQPRFCLSSLPSRPRKAPRKAAQKLPGGCSQSRNLGCWRNSWQAGSPKPAVSLISMSSESADIMMVKGSPSPEPRFELSRPDTHALLW
mmetsp:Transcript_138467/g.430581  ORF Transcript_138467/g.430581 Transcript_138467/m.430581 type:complete len:207 (+) Transcript_138467:78-698(+)